MERLTELPIAYAALPFSIPNLKMICWKPPSAKIPATPIQLPLPKSAPVSERSYKEGVVQEYDRTDRQNCH